MGRPVAVSVRLGGSAARNERDADSDIDLLVSFNVPVSLFDLFHLEDRLSQLLGGAKIDLVLRPAVIKELQDTIYGEAIDVVGAPLEISTAAYS